MVAFITDRYLERRLIRRRRNSGADRYDEVWEGVYVMNAMPNIEHQTLVGRLTHVLQFLVDDEDRGLVLPGCNVSDRKQGWRQNYRVPDVAVFLKGGAAVPKRSHWLGGPELAIEIVSPQDRSRKKLEFYAKVQTQELLIINRTPRSLELYRLCDGEMRLAGNCTPEGHETITTQVVPLDWRLSVGTDRPVIEAARLDGSQRWLI